MKRELILVAMVVVVILSATASARTGAWRYYDGGYHWVDYGHRSYYSHSRPVVHVGVGYSYSYGYGRGPAGYPNRSLFDSLTGETDRKVLQIQAREQEFRHGQEESATRRAEEERLFAWASQRAREQKLEEENRLLRERLAAMERMLASSQQPQPQPQAQQ